MRRTVLILISCLSIVGSGCSKKYDWKNPLDPANNTAPNVPILPCPHDGAKVYVNDITLTWSPSNDNNSGDTITYDVYFGTNNPPTAMIATGQSGNAATVHQLAPTTIYYWKVIARDNHGYVSAGQIWSLKRVPDIHQEGSLAIAPYYGRDVKIVGNKAYIAAQGDGGLRIIDISNPTAPYEIGHCDSLGGAEQVSINGNYAYFAAGSGGLRVIDIADPTHPTEVGHFDTPGRALCVVASGNFAFVADESCTLRVFNISNPSLPAAIGKCKIPNTPYNMVMLGKYVYIAGSSFTIIDVSNPSYPYQAELYQSNKNILGVAVSDRYAYLVDVDGGFQVFDIGDPAHLNCISSIGIQGIPRDVYNTSSYAYVVGEGGFHVIDVGNPCYITETGSFSMTDYPKRSFTSGRYAYVANSSGLVVLDLGN